MREWRAGFACADRLVGQPIYRWTARTISGHTLKHVIAAWGLLQLAYMLSERTRLPVARQSGLMT
jgi:hypothetical protein